MASAARVPAHAPAPSAPAAVSSPPFVLPFQQQLQPPAIYHAGHVPAKPLTDGMPPAGPAAGPAAGLHQSMQQHFVQATVGANGKPIYFVDRDEAFTLAPSLMDAAWVEKFGCADLGPPPSAKSFERHQMKIKEICDTCDAPLPPTFVDRPHHGRRHCACFDFRCTGLW